MGACYTKRPQTMSHAITISTFPLHIVKVITPVEGWDLREVEGGDVVAEKKGKESHIPIKCYARDFLDDLMYVKTREHLAKFLSFYHDPGIRDNVYVGTQYNAKFDMTFKGHVVEPQKKIFLSDV